MKALLGKRVILRSTVISMMSLMSIIAVAAIFTGCGPEPADIISFTGEVVYVPLEGGFYAIISDDGEKYDPVNLPEKYRQDGLKVRVTVVKRPEKVSFHMWGRIVEIKDISAR